MVLSWRAVWRLLNSCHGAVLAVPLPGCCYGPPLLPVVTPAEPPLLVQRTSRMRMSWRQFSPLPSGARARGQRQWQKRSAALCGCPCTSSRSQVGSAAPRWLAGRLCS